MTRAYREAGKSAVPLRQQDAEPFRAAAGTAGRDELRRCKEGSPRDSNALPQTQKVRFRPRPRHWRGCRLPRRCSGRGGGSNQITPMLLVYRHTLALGTGTLEAMFGFYALGLIPGLLLAGPLSDARGRA
jgi:hypothetical protein